MVTILEPRQTIPSESIPSEAVPALEKEQPRKPRTYEFGYSVPFAGVKFYSFRPSYAPPVAPEFLPIVLIDEKVILI